MEENISLIKGLKVLVVHDNEDSQILLSIIFETYQAEIKTATSVDEVINIIVEWQPDILISDISIKEKDGYLLIRSIREKEKIKGRFVPAVVLTAYPQKRSEALEAGFQEIILKPFELDEFLAQVAKLTLTTITTIYN